MTDGFETRAIHAGQAPDPATGAVVIPITLSTTFAQRGAGEPGGFAYARAGNPTRAALEECVAALESGTRAFAFASGMSAEDAALRALVGPGDHVLLPAEAYGGTFRLVTRLLGPAGVAWSVADLTDPTALDSGIRPETRVVWLESPTNPTLGIIDIAAVAAAARARGVTTVIDNTFATPYLQRPLELGADAVVHSSTKYLGGHSDVLGGVVVTSDPELADRLELVQTTAGAVPSPFDCALVLRGIKTLAVRMDRHSANARAVAELLSGHPAVSLVRYPGLPEHPGHATATRQMRDYGGMVSFVAAGGEPAARRFVVAMELFTLAESLGGVESLVGHPATMSHASVVGTEMAVDPALVRLSVGIETIDDLLADVRSALDRTSGG